MFSYRASMLNFLPVDGMKVLIKGKVSVYEATGAYQVYVDPESEDYKENDQALIDMLKTAADDFATGEAGKTAKEDKQYQNAIYSELLAAANNGDYTEAQIKDLANRFGIEDPDNILGDAAKLAQEGKDKTTSENSALNILDLKDKGYINAETTDDEIEDYIDSGLINEGDLEKVKEERTKMATLTEPELSILIRIRKHTLKDRRIIALRLQT